jgi:hypothetical protein
MTDFLDAVHHDLSLVEAKEKNLTQLIQLLSL